MSTILCNPFSRHFTQLQELNMEDDQLLPVHISPYLRTSNPRFSQLLDSLSERALAPTGERKTTHETHKKVI